ncbi:MAG: hypothetical protein IPI44_10515 [Sulfuritalea sp.]|nr:hypothetical protein [Sulfuritalea sp.]
MMKATVRALAAAVILTAGSLHHASAQDAGFDIVRFQVEGNTLLPAERVQALVAPFVGRGKVYGDVQKALEALEGEFRSLGYGTVQVYVPEQELTSGVVRLLVSEGVVGKVTITGNKYFNNENIRASLPNLKEGTAPNLRQLSENVQLSNENPAKQVDVTLGVSEDEGKVDVKVDVKEEDPERFFVTLDNTGTQSTGKHRVGVSYQNANLFNSDQVLTVAYTTAIDPPGGMKVFGNRVNPGQDGDGVEVDIFSIGYRLPLYSLGDSIDFIYGNSNTTSPSNSAIPGGTSRSTARAKCSACATTTFSRAPANTAPGLFWRLTTDTSIRNASTRPPKPTSPLIPRPRQCRAARQHHPAGQRHLQRPVAKARRSHRFLRRGVGQPVPDG